MKSYYWLVGIAVVVIGLIAWVHVGAPQLGADTAKTVSDNVSLAGIQTGAAPWAPEIDNLKARLYADGLPLLAEEGVVLHIHQHLDVFLDGVPLAIPADIGIDEHTKHIAPIHVHDTSGIIHVESPFVASFTLGQVFDVWGVRFSKDCIGGYCTDTAHHLNIFVNGTRYDSDPRTLVLQPHQEIAITYGTDSETPKIPASYVFPEGY